MINRSYAYLNVIITAWGISPDNYSTLFVIALIIITLIISAIYLFCLYSSLKGKLDFVYDQETGEPLNVIEFRGCCCCKKKKKASQ